MHGRALKVSWNPASVPVFIIVETRRMTIKSLRRVSRVLS
jgi:hypothetical protein